MYVQIPQCLTGISHMSQILHQFPSLSGIPAYQLLAIQLTNQKTPFTQCDKLSHNTDKMQWQKQLKA